MKKESPSDVDSDYSDGQLVVDETPRKRKRENKSASAIKPGSLKLKLSGTCLLLLSHSLSQAEAVRYVSITAQPFTLSS